MAEEFRISANKMVLVLSEEEFAEFEKVLEMPLEDGRKLKELFKRKSVFEDEPSHDEVLSKIAEFRYAVEVSEDEYTTRIAQGHLEYWLDLAESQGIHL